MYYDDDLIKVVSDFKKYLLQEKEKGIKEILFIGTPRVGLESLIVAEKSAKRLALEALKKQYEDCQNCRLGKSRIKLVFGSGNPEAELMFIGEGPGYEEDRQGLPFVGPAGKLLTKIIESIGLKREEVFIANIVKCHPMKDPSNPQFKGNDRPPDAEEIESCWPILLKQIEIIKPRIICALGTFAARTLLKTDQTIGNLRGRFYDFNGIKLMPTLHPASCLYHESNKKYVWVDMKMIRAELARNK
jgi:uracil-DNA glycosylase